MIANDTLTLLLFNEVNEQRLRHRKIVSEALLSISPFNAKSCALFVTTHGFFYFTDHRNK